MSMTYPFDPAWRGLVHAPGLSMWTFPDDYPRRVGDAVYGAAPELRREATTLAPPPETTPRAPAPDGKSARGAGAVRRRAG